MNLETLNEAAACLFQRHNLAGWQFEVSNRFRRMLGVCNYQQRVISLGEFYARNNPDHLVMDTLLHEVAHALTPGQNHNAVWKAMAVQLGCVPKASSIPNALLPPGRFFAICPTCRKTYFKHRLRYQAGYYCLTCGTKDGALVFANRGEK